jgi:hypothetical protein
MIALTLLATAVSLGAAPDNETVETLKGKAESADGGKKVELLTKVAERQVEEMAKAYEEGSAEQARSALKDVREYGLKAAEEARTTGKRLKKTEIAIRKISNRLDDIRRTLSVDERPPVTSTIEKLEDARTALLQRMFSK